MKKMLSLLMALLMLVLCTATAETTAETQTVLSPNGSYSLDVPADCIVMNGESMAELITSDAMAELMTQLFGLESASELEAYLAQLDAANMLCIYTSGLKGCINTQTSAASMTMEQMTAMKSLLDEAISQQYVQMGFKQEDIVYQEMETVGDYTWYGIKASMLGVQVQVRMTVVDGVQYSVSFTDVDDAVSSTILTSFRVYDEPVSIAPADTAPVTELQTITSPAGDYSFAVPADFIPTDSDTMKTLITMDETRRYVAEAAGLEDASQLDAYFESIRDSNMIVIYDSSFMGNLNVQCNAATLTMDMLVLMKSVMDQAILQQYAQLGVPEESVTLMDIQTIADRRWYGAKFVFMGLNMQTMITVEAGKQFTFTFTELDDAVVQTMLESFTVYTAE